jgi:carboxymethylenebutenolidase
MGQWKDLKSADGTVVPAYIAEPAGAPRGGVVVLQEIFGLNSHIRAVADGYAAEGWRAVAPATFQRVQPGVELGYGEADMQQGQALKAAVEALPVPGVLADIQAAIDEAAAAGKVGIVGFCWGGLLSWRAACTLNGLAAAVTYYGGGMTVKPEIGRTPRVPVLSHFGRRDHFIAAESVAAFQRAHPEVEGHLYDADHGFNCDQRGSYDAPSAQRARERTQAFFDKHLG